MTELQIISVNKIHYLQWPCLIGMFGLNQTETAVSQKRKLQYVSVPVFHASAVAKQV